MHFIYLLLVLVFGLVTFSPTSLTISIQSSTGTLYVMFPAIAIASTSIALRRRMVEG